MPPPTFYQYLTLANARAQLASRLYDPTMTFWQSAELTLYIQEALRTFNALTSKWRNDFTFRTDQPSFAPQWFDLADIATVPNTTRPFTLTDASLYPIIEYHLLEPTTGINPYPANASSQFTASDLLFAVARCRDELVSRSGCTQKYRLVGAAAGRTFLPDTVIDVRRIAYLPNAPGVPSVLFPADTWDEEAFNTQFTILPAGTPGTPSAYLMSTQPPLAFDVDTPPSFAGQYELVTIESQAAATPTAPVLLRVPDDWAWVIKWGALADLLSRESNARDPFRAAYAAKRYEMGVGLLTDAAALLALRSDNVPLQIDSLRHLDEFNTSWEAAAAAPPLIAGVAGLNLIAIAPKPDTNPPVGFHSLTATVVQNAPIPVADADFVQASREDLDSILDYAQHLAAFKQGGAEFAATEPLLTGFLDQCAVYNRKLAEMGEFTSTLLGVSQREDSANPRRAPAAAGGDR